MMQDISKHPPGELEALEARFGLRLAAHLNAAAEELPHAISERLRFAREQALARQQTAVTRQPQETTRMLGGRGTTLTLGGRTDPANESHWNWLGRLLPLLFLLLGLVAIDEWLWQQQIHEAAEIDSILLADDLPPTAYSDPGFAAFLKASAGR